MLIPLSELNNLIYPNQGPALCNWGPRAVLFLLQIQVLEGIVWVTALLRRAASEDIVSKVNP